MTNCLVFLKDLSKFNVKYLDLLRMKFFNLYFHILGTNIINYQKRKIKINSLNDTLKDFNIDFIIVNVDNSCILKTSDLFNNLKFIKIVNCFSNIPLNLAKQTENSLYFHNNCDLNYILKTVDGLKLNLKNTQNKNNIVSKELEDFSNLCLSYSNKQINVRNKSIKRKGIYEAVYIEFRSLKHSEFIIKNCIIKLHDKWSHTVICCNDNYMHTVDLCSRINKNVNIIKLDITNATYNDYNNLLLSKEFWELLNGEKILIYQSDSLIYNSNIDDFLKYDYIGMPFLIKHYILSPSSVGNGGLSLRSKKTMLDVLNNTNCNKKCSNIAEHFRVQHKFDNIPEDIFFSQNIQNLKLGLVPDDNVGKLFALSDNINCFGMHAIWKYNKSWKPLIVEFMEKNYSTNFQKAELGKVAHFDTAKHLSTDTICNENAFGMYADVRMNKINIHDGGLRHYLKFGKNENRVCCLSELKNKYKNTLKNENVKLNNFKKNNNTGIEINKYTIHIIVRTHLRENEFGECLQSVIDQNYTNYVVHVVYDHQDCNLYIDKWKKTIREKMQIHKVRRSSDGNAFFDLYCEEIKNKITDGWIMFLDDDNKFMHNNCLEIINSFLQDSFKIIVWSFLRPDKLIITDLHNVKYGDIDNCSYIFHSSIKYDSSFADYYGSDFTFIKGLLNKHQAKQIDYTIVTTQYHDKISNYDKYINDDEVKFVDPNRIDFDDYKNHYDDLKHLRSIEKLKNHYNKFGKYESRVIKFLNFDYDLFRNTINHYNTCHKSNIKFILITTLYNEMNKTRLKEYQICLEHHQKNQFIEKIVVFYDDSKGDNKILKKCFNNLNKIEIIKCSGRPYFIELFNYSNLYCDKKNIIICNSDIIFDHTLYKFEHIDLKNTLYALTRWEYVDEKTCTPRRQHGNIMNSSKDAWIFRTPFCLDNIKNNDKFKKIQIGTWNCDGALNHFFRDKIINECLNIKSYHVHFCNGRTVKDTVIIY